jgi:hypothetical protein
MKYVAYMAGVLLSYSTSGPNIFPQPAEVLATEAGGRIETGPDRRPVQYSWWKKV